MVLISTIFLSIVFISLYNLSRLYVIPIILLSIRPCISFLSLFNLGCLKNPDRIYLRLLYKFCLYLYVSLKSTRLSLTPES